MNAKHIPGPWIVDTAPEGPHKIRHAGRYGHVVVALVPPAEGWSLLHQDHNACLIAAAPDLLEALKALLGLSAIQMMQTHHEMAIKESALAAIAKAEGR